MKVSSVDLKRTIVLISGHGTNLQAIIDEINENQLPIDITAVISDNPQAYGLERAKKFGIPTHVIDRHSTLNLGNFHHAMEELVKKLDPDLIILAGYMSILSKRFCHQFIGKILNIHPSLLPKFKGLNTYQKVLESGDNFHGSSIHFVTHELDSGPIVLQYRIRIKPADNLKTLQHRVQLGEYIIYPMAIRWFAEGTLKLVEGEVLLNNQLITEPRILEEV